MPPRGKKLCKKKVLSPERTRNGDEKENIFSEINDGFGKLKPKEEKAHLLKQEAKQKTTGFWSKKLQDLELEEGDSKRGKHSLYEFNETDGSMFNQKAKKSKRQPKGTRKKADAFKCKKPVLLHQKLVKQNNKILESQKKVKQIKRQSLFREQIILNREREKLADKNEKFTFSTGMQSLGITSTPAVKKDNLIGASNFLFLSPITSFNEDAEYCGVVDASTLLKPKDAKSQKILSSNQDTPKADLKTRGTTFKRVLRSRKILNT